MPILSLYYGFLSGEDLSTGGSKIDFYKTFPAVTDFSNLIFNTTHEHTRHFPFHYFILSIPHYFFDDIYITRVFYLLFSLILPLFVYLNLCKIYPNAKTNNLIISSSLLFLPFYKASAIWPNAHLTSLIFLAVANYCYVVNLQSEKFIYKFLNIFFLSMSTYCVQSYAVFFLFYLVNYYRNSSIKDFFIIITICTLFSIPGFYFIFTIPKEGLAGLEFTENLSYTIMTNLSIIFFFLIFFLINNNNFLVIKKYISNLSIYEFILLFFFFSLLLLNYKGITAAGGGFFYKLSFFLFKNKILYFITAFFGFLICYLFFKNDKKIFYTIFLINFTAVAYYTSQKYFEPLLIVSILIFHNNFLVKNIIDSFKNTLTFYVIIFIYFILATINNDYSLSRGSFLLEFF
tara:strand:- start:813 stop:2018 length:1206 start_codon:yes stop_codon:yes gene_type:complete